MQYTATIPQNCYSSDPDLNNIITISFSEIYNRKFKRIPKNSYDMRNRRCYCLIIQILMNNGANNRIGKKSMSTITQI